ncbi:MAG: FAD-dependent oxidoreductase, partial [Bacteroidota bacterium]|nr:FAD-dependent oxidoreductase [Bacteroidota bacterium]
KLTKSIIDRRIELMYEEGIRFQTSTTVGKDITAEKLLSEYDAVLLAVGAMKPRDLNVEGRELKGVYFALEFLKQQNQIVGGAQIPSAERIDAKNKKVLVIGGGDTGSDCVGTSIRHKAASVTQIEIMPKPPVNRTENNPWPYWPNVLRTSSSHHEGCERRWSLTTKRIFGENGVVTGVEVVQVEWVSENGRMSMREIPGTEEIIQADLVLLSMGFVHPVHEGLLNDLSVEYDARGNVSIGDDHSTSKAKVFAAGDAATGASLVVRAIKSGRDAAENIDRYLKTIESL